MNTSARLFGYLRAFSLLLFVPFMLTCSEFPELRPCVINSDCPPERSLCKAQICVPRDPCAAGIYVADRVPDRRNAEGEFALNALVRQVSGLATGVSTDEGELRVVNAGEPRLFEIDYFDDNDKPADLGLFVETRMRLEPDSVECTAVLYLWPTRTDQVKICFGGGRIGLARPGGGSTSLVDAPPDLTEEHVYRIEYKPVDAQDADGEVGDARFVIELWIDDEPAAVGLTIDNLPAPDAASDRAPLIGFGAEAAGTVSFDYVRWGCDVSTGTCLPALQEDDSACETERQNEGACGGAARAVELCDNEDNDCDGKADEDFTATFPEGRPISFDDFGTEVFKGEACGLTGACAPALVVCSDDKLGLRCDVDGLSVEETCDGQDNDCDGLADEDFGPQSMNPDRKYLDPLTGDRLSLGDPCGVGACGGGEVTCENLEPICSTDRERQDVEFCGNAVDDDCDGQTDEGFDLDGDGFQDCQRCAVEECEAGPHDCNDRPDTGANINPEAAEACNGIDDNCNGLSDENLDVDGDGFLPCDYLPANERDCDDNPNDDEEGEPTAFERNPGAVEVCDSVDNDCDQRVDEGFADTEADGRLTYRRPEHCGRCGNSCEDVSQAYNTRSTCESDGIGFGCSTICLDGFFDVSGDLVNASQFWNAEGDELNKGCECRRREDRLCDSGADGCAEICNNVDDDCDGVVDEEADMDLPTCWDGDPSQRQVGICRDGRRACIDGVLQGCFGSTLPERGQESLCDNRDEDCDGRIDEGDSLTDPSGQIRAGDDCATGLDGICASGRQQCQDNEMRCIAVANANPETCNGLDDDCDGIFEEDTDADGDGVPRCRPCANGEAPNAEGFCEFDCNDSAANGREGQAFSPNINERCTGLDNDCDERIDEDFVLTDIDGHPITLAGERAFRVDQLVYNQIENCGACGQECARFQGLTNCDRGTCELVGCREGYLDEDGNPDNGCEQSDCREDNVGAANVRLIGTACSKPMYDNASECACSGVFQCVRRGGLPAVECVVDPNNPDEGDIVSPAECPAAQRANVAAETCDNLDNDCDGQADEIFVRQDNEGEPILDNDGNLIYATVEHCGACNTVCSPPFTLISNCGEGTCEVDRCQDGRVNLDGNDENGCEYACVFGGREICNNADDDCDGEIDEDFDFDSDLNNCGRCGIVCTFANADASCVAGECTLGACDAGFDNCDQNAVNGCETDLNDESTCGGCNNSCNPDATSRCVNQQCKCGQNDPCVGDNPVCDDITGTCTGCLNDLDCGDPTPVCVGSSCRECDPLSHAQCTESGQTPFCSDGTCRACQSDAECVVRPGLLDFCDEDTGTCVECDPSNNSGCPANLPTCDVNSLECRACQNADDCLGSACVNGTCSGCDLDTNFPCSGATPICALEEGGSPECRACEAGDAGDAECAAKDASTPQCVQGRCQACDPGDNAGCGDNQLCCNFICVDTDPDVQCETCGVACNATTTNSCVDRSCTCGDSGECGGQTAFCDDDAGACVDCRNDDDCSGARPECVDNSCETCDPEANFRCDAGGTSPICDPDNKFCRGCAADADCTADAAIAAGVEGGECVLDGSCRFCDPLDNANCDAAGVRPICDADNYDCRTCAGHPECDTNENGNVCAGSGRCTACQSDADCDGHPDGNLCNDGVNPALCGTCADDAACANHPDGNRCIGDLCVACAVSADCAGNPAGETCVNGRCAVCEPGTNEGCTGTEPICANGQCQACQSDLECGDGFYCIEADGDGIAAADVGSCQRCDPDGDTGCDPESERPVCDPTFFLCRVCAADSECGDDQQCVSGACEVCDPTTDDGCDAAAATPVCRDVNGTPACTACQSDDECAENPRNGDICVDGACVICDTADNSGCGDDELCCDAGGGAECVGTGSGDGEVCTACNVNGCNANSTNTCTNRTCVCGDGAACDADDFCVGGTCVNCVRDADCSQDAAGQRCVLNDCVECRDNSDCRGVTPVCDGNSCRGCANNAECGNASVCQQDGSCTGDRDADGVDDAADNCPDDQNADQADNDADGSGDACDDDDDNDGVADDEDNCPFTSNADQTNSDGAEDGGDACDDDNDNDGLLDAVDNCPVDANQDQADADGDGTGDVCDNDRDGDGVTDAADNCPDVQNADQADADNDDIGDICDDDRDGDNVNNDVDNCPDTSNENQLDSDNDGLGNPCDPDRDGDDVANAADNCPDDANADQLDANNNGVGDVCDDDRDGDGVANGADNCPDDQNADQANNDNDDDGDVCDDDDDNDTVLDNADNCPFTANQDQANNDNDADGDACDDDDDNDGDLDNVDNCPFIANPDQANNDADADGDVCDDDDDNDGVLDAEPDNCPFTANADQADLDSDGAGDACDTDDENDGVLDENDNCPLIANADQANNDGDDDGDACDDDDDNDGVLDIAPDNCPFDANADQTDTDNDNEGDACDTDDDNDTILDAVDNCPLAANQNQTDGDGDGVGDVCDNCSAGSNADQTDTDDNGEGDICDSPLVINEIDYSNDGGDNAEFIEILNVSNAQVNLNGVELQISNSDGTATVTLSNANATIDAGQYLVIGDAGVTNNLAQGVLSLAIPGAALPDDPTALIITDGNRIYDAVAYGGAVVVDNVTLGETSPTVADDNNTATLERCANGADTGDNSSDFQLSSQAGGTPGAANTCN